MREAPYFKFCFSNGHCTVQFGGFTNFAKMVCFKTRPNVLGSRAQLWNVRNFGKAKILWAVVEVQLSHYLIATFHTGEKPYWDQKFPAPFSAHSQLLHSTVFARLQQQMGGCWLALTDGRGSIHLLLLCHTQEWLNITTCMRGANRRLNTVQ